jgi:HSP20 family molecular chaperone IbpA
MTVMKPALEVKVDTESTPHSDINLQSMSILTELNNLLSIYSEMSEKDAQIWNGESDFLKDLEGIHVTQTPEKIYVTVELPSECLGQLSINILNGKLVIYGLASPPFKENACDVTSPVDRCSNFYCRCVPLKQPVDAGGLRISTKPGRLYVVLPKLGAPN